ncbi:hypothetical protein FACS189464_1640 [Bacteroidia bacterium]|nr:hypothetical protein FACS189464_1640 [Bacteroidia bacterium]
MLKIFKMNCKEISYEMNNISYKGVCFLLGLTLSFSLFAQQEGENTRSQEGGNTRPAAPHELGVHTNFGYSTLRYDLMFGRKMGGFNQVGGDFGLDYTYLFSKHFGVYSGVGMAVYRAKADLSGAEFVIPDLQGYEARYDLHTRLDGYKEKQRSWMAVIPLMLHYQTDIQKDPSHYSGIRGVEGAHKFYARAGLKVGIPTATRYSVRNATVSNWRYYPNEGVTLNNRPVEGLGTFAEWKTDGRLKLGTAWMTSIEAGVKWGLEENVWFYTGIYFDYGLNNINKSAHNDNFLNMPEDNPSAFTTRSVHTAQQKPGVAMTGSVAPIAAGVTLRLTFGFPRKKQTWKLQHQPPVEQPAPEIPATATPDATPDSIETPNSIEIPDDIKNIMAHLPGEVFAFDSYELTPEAQAAMDYVAGWLSRHANIHIKLEGHTDNTGSAAYNQKLSERRAKAMCDYLITKGIASERLSYQGYGFTKPKADNETEEGRQKNRRVEITIGE